MTMPPNASASRKARPDLPLAVGPAMSIARFIVIHRGRGGHICRAALYLTYGTPAPSLNGTRQHIVTGAQCARAAQAVGFRLRLAGRYRAPVGLPVAAWPGAQPVPPLRSSAASSGRGTWRWTTALTLPGYGYYLDPATGERPQVYVAFVNIERHASHGPASPASCSRWTLPALAVLDARERNYERTTSPPNSPLAVEGMVWTYVGLPDAAARFRQGLATRSARHRGSLQAAELEAAFARARLPYAAELPDDIPRGGPHPR